MDITRVITGSGTIYAHISGAWEGDPPPEGYGAYAWQETAGELTIILAGFGTVTLYFEFLMYNHLQVTGILYDGASGTGQIDAFATDECSQPPEPSWNEYGWAPPYSWSTSLSVNITLTLNMSVNIEQIGAADQQTSFHHAYTADWAPYDRTPNVVGPVYTLNSATLEVTCGSLWSKSFAYDVEDIPSELYKYGLKSGYAIGGNAKSTGGSGRQVYSASVSGISGSPSGSLSVDIGTLTYGGGSAGLVCSGSGHLSGGIGVMKGAYSTNYSGTIKNIDGTVPAVAANISTIDDAGGYTDEDGIFEVSKSYDGHYEATLTHYLSPTDGTIIDSDSDVKDDVGPSYNPTDDTSMIVLNAWIGNCRAMGEPEFPWSMETGERYINTDGTNEYPVSFYGASDKRLPIRTSMDYLEDALTITVPTSKSIISQFAAADWTVVEGAATITDTTDGIQVVVTSAPCRIKKTHSATLAGGRYADLLFTTNQADDTDSVDVYLATRQYQISPADYEIDLIAPVDIDTPAVDMSQTAWTGSPTWGWGIHDVGDIEFGNLQADRVYTFKSLTLKRKHPFQVLVDGGTCTRKTGTSVGASDLGGPYALAGDPNSTYYSRTAVVIVDGIVAAEIMGMTHYTGDMGKWQHVPEALSATGRYYPNDGLVEFDYPEEATNIPIIYLARGHYTSDAESTSIAIDTYAQATKYAYPFNSEGGGAANAGASKRLRARLLVRAISKSGSDIGTVKLRKYDKVDGALLSEQDLTADDSGAFTAALQCPTTKQGTITSVTDSTHFVVDGLDKDYTGYTVYLLSGAGGTEYYGYPQANVIASHNVGTGEVVLTNSLTGPQPDVGQKIWVHLDYRYDLLFPDGTLLCDIEGNLLADETTGSLLAGGIIGQAVVAPRNTTYITALVS
ncbi:hypothetical protein LLG46_02420 [bacterium]|nr:hypothetical protein [bacterium]